jgi:hypothetical protein
MPTTTIKLAQLRDSNTILLRDGSVPLTANFNAGNFKIVNLAAPTSDTDAVNKAYVDNLIAGLDPKASVRMATTANITLSGLQTIDAVVGVAGDRVLVFNQTTQSQNGIYVMGAGAWTRATDADTWNEIVSAFVFVEEGTIHKDKGYVCSSDQGGVINTTNVAFVLFANNVSFNSNNFVKKEVPSGAMDGTNVTFTLTSAPVVGTEEVYLNGIQQKAGATNDYTISAAIITYITAPVATDTLQVSYIK